MIGALCAAAAVLLAWSGLGKLRHPGPTARMLVGLLGRRLPGRGLTVRTIGALELTIGVAVLVSGGRTAAAALATAYLVFTAVAARLATRGRRAPCGCFGATEAPTGLSHLVVDALALAAAVAGTIWPSGALGGYAGQGGPVLVAGLGQVVVLAGLAYVLVTALPDVQAARAQLVGRS